MESINAFDDTFEGRLDVGQQLDSGAPDHVRLRPRVRHDKIRVWSGNELDELIFKRGTAVPWSEGEAGWNLA
jgi:hypothetical protein